MVRLLVAVISTLGLLFTAGVCAPAVAEPGIEPVGSVQVPEGPAPLWIVADMDSGQILAGREMYEPRPPASTIKTLLALTALDELDLNATTVVSEAATEVECNCAGVVPGGVYTARQLVEAALLVSGNDAANALADMLGGFDVAVDKMNVKAASVGAVNTHATSPSGLDGPGGPGWTTPRDLAVIFRAAMANPVLAQITAQPSMVLATKTGERVLVNQDELLVRYPGAIGGKTGYTYAARKTFVGAAQRDGRRLVIAMMYGLVRDGGPTYWDQAATLLDWGFAQGPGTSIAQL